MKGSRIRVYILSLGSLTCDTNALVAHQIRATALDPEPRLKFEPFPVWGLYIEHPQGKILVDTGLREDCQSGGESENFPINTPVTYREGEELIHQLQLCGVTPQEIDYVIMTHLHHDHSGRIGLFKNAQILVQRQEMIQALMETHTVTPKGVYLKADVDVDADWMLLDGDFELFPGIQLIWAPGHTEGMQCLLLHLEQEGAMLFTSDACYTKENWGPPTRPPGVLHDSKRYYTSIEKLRRIQAQTNAKVIFGHDMQQFNTLKKAPAYYE